ncbi:hypothetical protein ML462_03560 [Gramella lutea]|uniref:Uncharacterized protein n=1 Tax=Christiangramia lutea TaxID=1607951 RepID=A0A9X1V1D8_9FLAO|nr:hypothetical protein [Christiangramia lutea]MCH4822241.1 hypothetical protein [Christiangramia lutea]
MMNKVNFYLNNLVPILRLMYIRTLSLILPFLFSPIQEIPLISDRQNALIIDLL